MFFFIAEWLVRYVFNSTLLSLLLSDNKTQRNNTLGSDASGYFFLFIILSSFEILLFRSRESSVYYQKHLFLKWHSS